MNGLVSLVHQQCMPDVAQEAMEVKGLMATPLILCVHVHCIGLNIYVQCFQQNIFVTNLKPNILCLFAGITLSTSASEY